MKGNAQTLGDCTMSCSWYKCSLRERRLFPVEIGGNWKYVFVGRIRMEFRCPVFWALVKKDFSYAVAGLGRSSRVNFFLYRGSRLVASAEGSRSDVDTDKSHCTQEKYLWYPE